MWKRNCRVNVLAGELATQGETAFRDRDARVLERASEVSVWNAAPNTDEPSKHQYVHLGNDEGARLAFSQVQDWTATSWKLDDPRVEAATMRVWLKKSAMHTAAHYVGTRAGGTTAYTGVAVSKIAAESEPMLSNSLPCGE